MSSLANPGPPRPPVLGRVWPLVGRADELDSIRSWLTGTRSGAVVIGPPGVGRSRLLREAARRHARAEFHVEVLHAGSRPTEGPAAPFATLLGGAPADDGSVRRIAGALAAKAGGRRVMLCVDDAERLDEASVGMVAELAVRPAFTVLAAVRTGAASSAPVVALWKDELLGRIDVRPLAEPDVEELVGAVLGGPPTTATTRMLHGLTGGNVLLLRELVTAGLDSGTLTQVNGLWVWEGPLVVSDRLHDIVRYGIGRLTDGELQVIDVLAHGQRLEARVLESLFPADTLRAVEERALVACVPGPRSDAVSVELVPPLFGAVLRERAPHLHARSVRRRILAALPERPADDDSLLLHARLRLDHGGVEDPAALVAVARTAMAASDDGFAEAAARLAYQRDAPGAAGVLAEALHRRGMASEALQILDRHAGAAGGGDPVGRATLRAEVLGWGLGRADEAADILARAGGGDLRAALRAEMDLCRGRPGDAEREARAVVRRTAGEGRAGRRAVSTLVTAGARGRRPLDAVTEAERYAGRHPELALAHGMALQAAGRLAAAAEVIDSGYRELLRRGDVRASVGLAVMSGRLALDRGDLSGATRRLTEAALLGPAATPGAELTCHAWLAEVAALRGNAAAAAEHLAAAAQRQSAMTGSATSHLVLASAWHAWADVDPRAAVRLAVRAAETAECHGDLQLAATAWHTVARLNDPHRAAVELQRLDIAGGPTGVYLAHASALVSADGEELDASCADFERLGAALLAAEAGAAASTAHRAKGRNRSGRASAARARLLLSVCGGHVRTPGLLSLAAPALTPREREICALAADGLSSRSIATRLTLSVRTVDNHLQTAYGKLSVTGRRELAAVLRAS